MKVKITTIIFVVLIVLSMFAACGVPTANDVQESIGAIETTPLGTTEDLAYTEDTEEITESTTESTEPATEDTDVDATNPVTEPIETIEPPTDETTIQTEPEPTSFQIKLSFAGDCTLSNVVEGSDGGFMSYSQEYDPSYFLEKVKPIFEQDDFTVVNLECVLSDQSLEKRDKGDGVAFWFKGPTRHAEILTSGSVEGVSLANNHTFDYGNSGYQDTKDAVVNAGLQYGLESDIMYFEKNGFVIAVICNGLWYEEQANDIVQLIKIAEEKSDYQIVFYHGGTEKEHAPESWRIRASRKLVDNGADLVIGNHPHVLQPIETYNNIQIIYSLGNFCYGGHSQPQNRTMIYQVVLTIDCDLLQVVASEQNIIPCYVYTSEYNNYQPAPIENDEEIDRVLRFLDGDLELPY